MAVVDVVVVSYNSRGTLRACVEPLVSESALEVLVVDNASPDESLADVADLPLERLPLDRNFGFAYACNRGFEAGSAPYVLFLNPDARISADSIQALAGTLASDETLGAVAPRLLTEDGEIDYSVRRFPRLRSTFSQALFLHRLFPRADWVDEVVRQPSRYEKRGPVEWVSGACVLVRREALDSIGGWDERFFLYGEDVDLCRRFSERGLGVVYEPAATAVHVGGASAPRAQLIPLLVRGRALFVGKHDRPAVAFLHRVGLAVGSLTHAVLTTQGSAARRGHLRSFRVALRPGAASTTGNRGQSAAASDSRPHVAG